MERFTAILRSSMRMPGKGYLVYDTLTRQVVAEQVRWKEWADIICENLNNDPSMRRPARVED